MNNFSQVVQDCGIFDIGYKGFPFTWSNNFITPFSTRAMLDRALANKEWSRKFPEAEVLYLSTDHLDHLPLLLKTGTQANG
ncbi:hypothetical protein LIER_28687 [Lithospermum erythrorhizon]|uniref:Uncharacterized protein n=1 Tax=Lithospermum erythrorhizon TaxID=34254 RepID=A0AAV3RKV4_LITER